MATITLINPPRLFRNGQATMSQCLGLGYLASYLRAHGHAVQLIDALGLGFESARPEASAPDILRYGLPLEAILERIDRASNWIGISAPFFSSKRPAFELASAIRHKWPDKTILLGGNLASGLPSVCLANPNIDYIVIGEGEVPLSELMTGKPPESVCGVYSRRTFDPATSLRAEQLSNLDLLPYPARDLLPFDLYLNLSQRLRKGSKTVSVITSRGCPFDCSFCSVHPTFGYKWRFRSVDNIMGEVQAVIEQYGCDFIEFEDDNLTLNKSRAMELFSRIQPLGIHWAAPNGLMVEALDEDLLKQMKLSGCRFFFLPIESGDPAILKLMNKKVDLEYAADIAKTSISLGLRVAVAIIIGHPGETRASFMRTMAYCERLHKLGIREFAFLLLNTYPGTKVFKTYADAHMASKLAEFDFLGHGEVTLTTPDFDTRELNWRMTYANSRFVPKYVLFYRWNRSLLQRIKMLYTRS